MKNQMKNAKTSQSGKCCNKQKQNTQNAQQNQNAQNRSAQQPESCR